MISQEELWKQVAASQTPDEGHTSGLESTLSLDQKVSGTEAKQEVFLGFTSKEISKMPQRFRKLFRVDGLPVHCRKRKRGGSVNFELRYRANGLNISASGTTIERAKERFIAALRRIESGDGVKQTKIPTSYKEFCLFFFETFRKRKVTELTYYHDMSRCRNHIFPVIGGMALKAITPSDCQSMIDDLRSRGLGKTADEVFSLMNYTFKGAIAHGLITKNPLAVVFHQKHKHEHGKALTKIEEVKLISSSTPYRILLLIALYTGLRPNEYATLRREGNMLIAKNSKRKNGREEYKRIPINPMLAPYIGDMKEFHWCHMETLYKHLRRLMPTHTLYDLRTTFYTRCRECGVSDAARDEMVGHSSGVLADAYTDLSDAYLIQEANKIKYALPLDQ